MRPEIGAVRPVAPVPAVSAICPLATTDAPTGVQLQPGKVGAAGRSGSAPFRSRSFQRTRCSHAARRAPGRSRSAGPNLRSRNWRPRSRGLSMSTCGFGSATFHTSRRASALSSPSRSVADADSSCLPAAVRSGTVSTTANSPLASARTRAPRGSPTSTRTGVIGSPSRRSETGQKRQPPPRTRMRAPGAARSGRGSMRGALGGTAVTRRAGMRASLRSVQVPFRSPRGDS